MPKNFSVDFKDLSTKIYKTAYKLSDVQDRLESVGFDIVRFKDKDQRSNLWQIQKADDGDYIVALYEESEDLQKTSWDVALNKQASSIQIYYKGDPLLLVTSKQLNVQPSEMEKVASYLPTSLESNKKLVSSLLKELPESTKNDVLAKYPELL